MGHPVIPDPQASSDTPTGRHRAPKKAKRSALFAKRPGIELPTRKPRRAAEERPARPARSSVPSGRTGFALMEMLGFADTEETPVVAPRARPTPPSKPTPEPAKTAKPAKPLVPRARQPRTPTTPPPANGSSTSPSIFDLLPRLAEFKSGRDGENTGTLVERLWEATDSYQPQASWTSGPDDTLGNPASRWKTAALIVVAVVAAVLAIALTTELPTQGPATARTEAETVAVAAESIDRARQVAELIVHPETSGEDLSDAAVTLTALDSAARDLSVLGGTLIDDPNQEDAGFAMTRAAAHGTAAGRRLGDALTYRLIFARTFDLPELPNEAETIDVADLGFQVATMISNTEDSLERLPVDRAFEEHRALAAETVQTIENIVPDYLQALRDGDALAARAHANQIRRVAADVHAALLPALQQIATEVDVQLDEYGAALDGARETFERIRASVPQGS